MNARLLKDNTFIRGIVFFFRNYFGLRQFGSKGNRVIISPPFNIDKFSNVYIGDNVGIGAYSFLSATKAKLIIRGNSSISEHFTVHSGNHARIIGKFVSDISSNIKPNGFDSDVIIEHDVWIGCNVTILSGVHIGRGCTIAA